MSVRSLERALLLDSLDLLTTYLWAQTVELAPRAVGLQGAPDETDIFLAELSARHALASARTLRSVVDQIEDRASLTSSLRRAESKGVIRGRLDVPRYLARRSAIASLPRPYPIIVSQKTPDTPENALVVAVLKTLTRQLRLSPFKTVSAEARAVLDSLRWLQRTKVRWPWSNVRRFEAIDRLRMEALHRVRKRQTGNDRAYESLLEWIDEWRVDPARIGGDAKSSAIDGLLLFPASESFWERVFEVWVLQETASSLGRLGFKAVEGPRPLPYRKRGPIYDFENSAGESVKIWFQRQEPVGKARWSYAVDNPLTGVPDVVIAREGSSPFMIDAKYRFGGLGSRAEEIYKMLGYSENFRAGLVNESFFGMLLFPAEQEQWIELSGPKDGVLGVAATPAPIGVDTKKNLDSLIGRWLAA